MLSVVMYVLSVSASLFWGYPKSLISILGSEGHSPKARAHTVNKLIYDHKVILHRFFVDFAEVSLADRIQAVAELKDKRGISVVPTEASATAS